MSHIKLEQIFSFEPPTTNILMPHIWPKSYLKQTSLTNGKIYIVIYFGKLATIYLKTNMQECGILGHLGGKKCNARGVFATATYKGGPYFNSGPLLRGSDRSPPTEVGANLLVSPRPTYQITTPGRLDPSSTLGVHDWWAILLYHNRGTKWLANPNSIFVNLNCFVLLNLFRGAAEIGRRTTYPVEWSPTPHRCQHMDCLGPGRKIFKRRRKKTITNHFIQKIS